MSSRTDKSPYKCPADWQELAEDAARVIYEESLETTKDRSQFAESIFRALSAAFATDGAEEGEHFDWQNGKACFHGGRGGDNDFFAVPRQSAPDEPGRAPQRIFAVGRSRKDCALFYSNRNQGPLRLTKIGGEIALLIHTHHLLPLVLRYIATRRR